MFIRKMVKPLVIMLIVLSGLKAFPFAVDDVEALCCMLHSEVKVQTFNGETFALIQWLGLNKVQKIIGPLHLDKKFLSKEVVDAIYSELDNNCYHEIKRKSVEMLVSQCDCIFDQELNPLRQDETHIVENALAHVDEFYNAIKDWRGREVMESVKEEFNYKRDSPYHYEELLASCTSFIPAFAQLCNEFASGHVTDEIKKVLVSEDATDYLMSLDSDECREIKERIADLMVATKLRFMRVAAIYQLKEQIIATDPIIEDLSWFKTVGVYYRNAISIGPFAGGLGTFIGMYVAHEYDTDRIKVMMSRIVHGNEIAGLTRLSTLLFKQALETANQLTFEVVAILQQASEYRAHQEFERMNQVVDTRTELRSTHSEVGVRREGIYDEVQVLQENVGTLRSRIRSSRLQVQRDEERTNSLEETKPMQATIQANRIKLLRARKESDDVMFQVALDLINIKREIFLEELFVSVLPQVIEAVSDGRIIFTDDDPVAVAHLYADKERIVDLAGQLEGLEPNETITV